jgi:teichuronic acid biosynthesis glycosyltransferase TuaH
MLNFIIFSLSRWNEEIGCNIRDISYELSKNHRVVYVDVPLKRKDRWFNTGDERVKEVLARKKSRQNLVQVKENLWHYIDFSVLESVNSISNNTIFDAINKRNNKRFARTLTAAIQAAGFDQYILLNDNDIYNGLYLKNYLNPITLRIYYLTRQAASHALLEETGDPDWSPNSWQK